MEYEFNTVDEEKKTWAEIPDETKAYDRARSAIACYLLESPSELKNKYFFGEVFIGLDLYQIDLSRSQFIECTFYDCKLMDCNLSHVSFQGSFFRKMDFSESDLTNVNFLDTEFPDGLSDFHLSSWFIDCLGIYYIDSNYGEIIFTNTMVKLEGVWKLIEDIEELQTDKKLDLGSTEVLWKTAGLSIMSISKQASGELGSGSNARLQLVVDNQE